MKTGRPFDYLEIKFYLEQELRLNGPTGGIIYTVINIRYSPLVNFPEYAVDLQELYNSCKKSGEYFILVVGGDGIRERKGIKVTHFEQYIQWHIYYPKPERILNFKKEEYIAEIERAISTFCMVYQENKQKLEDYTIDIIPYEYYIIDNYKFLKRKKKKK